MVVKRTTFRPGRVSMATMESNLRHRGVNLTIEGMVPGQAQAFIVMMEANSEDAIAEAIRYAREELEFTIEEVE